MGSNPFTNSLKLLWAQCELWVCSSANHRTSCTCLPNALRQQVLRQYDLHWCEPLYLVSCSSLEMCVLNKWSLQDSLKCMPWRQGSWDAAARRCKDSKYEMTVIQIQPSGNVCSWASIARAWGMPEIEIKRQWHKITIARLIRHYHISVHLTCRLGGSELLFEIERQVLGIPLSSMAYQLCPHRWVLSVLRDRRARWSTLWTDDVSRSSSNPNPGWACDCTSTLLVLDL